MNNDNNSKTVPKGQTDNKAVEKRIDKESPISLEEAKAAVEAEEGQIEEAIEKQKAEKDKGVEIAPDLKELKKELNQKGLFHH